MTKRHLSILGLYLVLALAATYPLITQIVDHVPGTETWAFDEYSFVWSQWWVKHALFDLGVNPLFTRYVFYPIGIDLSSFTVLWSHAVTGLPLYFALGLIPAVNLTVLSTFVLGAFGMYLFVGNLLRDSLPASPYKQYAAIIAGIAFAFTSSRMVYAALGHYNILATEWFPYYALFLVKTFRATNWKAPVLAAVFAGLTIYGDLALGVLLVLFTLLYWLFERRAGIQPRVLVRLLGLCILTALFSAPLLVPAVHEFLFSGYTLPGWGHAEKLMVDLFGFFAPTSLHPLNRGWAQELDLVRQGISRFKDVNTFFVGYATALVALLGVLIYRSKLRFWLASVLVFASFTLGPLLNVNGQSVFDLSGLQVTFPMPFLLLHYIPLLKENRVPNRYSILVVLALAVLIGFAMAWLLDKVARVRSRAARRMLAIGGSAFVAAVLLFEHLAIPLPLSDARIPPVYDQIAQEAGDFAILSLPLGWRNSFTALGAEDTRTQYYQTAHGKFLLSGNTSRNAPFLFDYFDRISLFHSLREIELYQPVEPEALERDKVEAPALMAFFDIRYVVINAATPNRLPYSDTRQSVMDYVQKVLPLGEKVYDRDGVIAYRVNRPPLPASEQVHFGNDQAYPYLAEGWDRNDVIAGQAGNFAVAQDARVLFPVSDIADRQVTLRALPFTFPGSAPQTIELFVNGQPVKRFEMTSGWQDYAARIPSGALRIGLNDLQLKFGYLARPRDVIPPNFAVGTTGISSPVDIVANSGDLGSIKVNGREESPLGHGYNVVVVDPKSGAVKDAKVFNTGDERAQSRALTDFIGSIPDGLLVAVAAQGRVAGNLGDNTVRALGSLGAQVDIRKNPERTHAFIGVKGVKGGTALEQSEDGTSFVAVGHNPDERTLAAAVSTITFEQSEPTTVPLSGTK